MVKLFLTVDRTIFSLIVTLPHPPYLISFFSLISGIGRWGILWFILALLLLIWEERGHLKILIALLMSLAISLFFIEGGMKNLFKRSRPDYTMDRIQFFFANIASYSFPSVHTTIAFAGAYIFATLHKRWKLVFYLIALLIGFSRIYLGLHYPSDVVIGALIGIIIGFISLRIATKIIK